MSFVRRLASTMSERGLSNVIAPQDFAEDRLPAESSKKQELILPHKALPENSGKLYQFVLKDRKEEYSYYTSRREHDDQMDMRQYVILMAHELMHTDIAINEGGFPSQPSVLILASGNAPEKPNAYPLWTGIQKQRRSYTEKSFHPYGRRRNGIFDSNNTYDFSESAFLSGITVYADTGINFRELPSRISGSIADKYLETARKFFDIVLFLPSDFVALPTSQADTLLVDTERPNYSHIEDDSTLSLYADMRGLAIDRMFFSSGLSLVRSEKVTFEQARTLSHDVIRHILGVQNPARSIEGLSKPSKGVKISDKVSKFFDYMEDKHSNVLEVMVGSTALATVCLPITFAFFFLGGTIMTIASAILAAPLVFGSLAIATAGVTQLNLDRAAKKYVKRITSLMETNRQGYPYLPVSATPIAKAFAHKHYLAETVERLNIGDQAIAEAMLPLDLINLRIDKLKDRWMEYELSPLKALEFPMLLDASAPSTSDFYAAFSQLETYEEQFSEDQTKAGLLMEALVKAEKTFVLAENNAKKVRLSYLNADQKKRIKNAKPLLAMAQDEGASPTERRGAWNRANNILEGVLALPEASVMGLLEATSAS